MTSEQLWQAVLGELELLISKANFTTWFKHTFVSGQEESKVIIGVPNAFTKSWLENKYHKSILKAIQNITDNQVKEVIYRIESIKSFSNKVPENPVLEVSKDEIQIDITTPAPAKDFALNTKYTFDNFVVGRGNELAHAASLAIVTSPGIKYNPLFIYGGVGLGKTHLIQAVGHKIQSSSGGAKVLYVNFEKFTNDYIHATQTAGLDKFRALYRGADVLLVDDVQFMVNKEKTQEEFFHTFESLHQQNKQIVVTADRPPRALTPLHDRLISRFEWGMIADISPPDLDTRIAILEAKCRERKMELKDEIIRYIANYVQSNVRELEGVLNKIIATYQFEQRVPTMESVKEIVSNMVVNPNRGATTGRQITKAVADFYEIPIDDLVGISRKKELVVPRQIVMYLMREEMKSSYPSIGADLGGRDHTTAMHACNKIIKELEKDERLRQDIANIKQRLASL